jgi:hypothetical protein
MNRLTIYNHQKVFEENSYEIIIFKLNFNFKYEKLFRAFCNIVYEFISTDPEPGQKTAASAPAKSCRYTGSATLFITIVSIRNLKQLKR